MRQTKASERQGTPVRSLELRKGVAGLATELDRPTSGPSLCSRVGVARATLLLALAVSCRGAKGGEGLEREAETGITASGTLTYSVPYLNAPPYVQEMRFEFSVVGGRWKARLHTRRDDSGSTTETVWDGNTLRSLGFSAGPLPDSARVVVTSSPIPRAGVLQALWLGFCLQPLGFQNGEPFPNLLAFEASRPKTNTFLRLSASKPGLVESAEIIYPFEQRDYVTERLTVVKHTNAMHSWVPVEFSREIFARLGVEFTPGQASRPTPGITYDRVLERFHVMVDHYEAASVEDTLPAALQGLALTVADERIGGHEFPLTYSTSNSVRSESELRADPALAAKIRSLEFAQKQPKVSASRVATRLKRVAVLAVFASIFVVFVMVARAQRKKQK